MKRFTQFGFLAVMAALVAAPAFAQGKFDLKKESGAGVQPLFAHATQYVTLQPAKTAGVKKLPETAMYGTQNLGGKTVDFVLDGDKLYIGNKDKMKDAKEVDLPVSTSGVAPTPMDVKMPGTSILFRITEHNLHFVALQPVEAMSGTVQLAGKSYKMAVIDGSLSGRWNDTFSPAKTGPATSAIFAIDLNGNGKFDDDPVAGEIMPLGKAIQVAGVWYAYEVAADGSAVTFKKFEGDMGTISVPGGVNLSLILSSDNGISTVTGGSGQFSVPAGNYTVAGLLLDTTDKDGAKWTLLAKPTNDMSTVKVAKGETTALKAGAPLVVKVDATRAGQDISLGLSILGQGGEPYAAGASKDGTQQESPKFKIVNESGKQIAADQFHYG